MTSPVPATAHQPTRLHLTEGERARQPAAKARTSLLAQGLSVAHAGAAPLFDGLDLAIAEREIVALVGGSGCGKSSLLRVLAGLAAPQAGTVRFAGDLLAAPHPRAALLFQQPSLLPWLRVADNVAFGLDFRRQPALDRAQREHRVHDALEAVGLGHAARLRPSELSGGMAQRVALARALARQPLLLFADEPFSALDAITRAEMQALLVDVVHRWHSAVLLVTHDIDEALAVADRVLLMGAHGRGLVGAWPVPADPAMRPALRPVIHAALDAAQRSLRPAA